MSALTKRAAVAALAAASVAAGALALGQPFGHTLADEAIHAPATAAPRADEVHTRALPDFTAIIKRYGPAVVNVSTVAASPVSDGSMTSGNDLLRRFGFPPFMTPQGNGGERQLVHGIGSGFIVKSDDVKVGSSGGEKVASAESGTGGQGKLGLQVRPLTPGERHEADLSGGVLVEGVSGPAARAGIQPGDVVLSVNGSPVGDVGQLRGLVSGAKGEVALLVQRGDARIFVPVDLG